MDSKNYLSKSRYKLALECPTKLYYSVREEYANKMAQDEFMMALAEGGFQVGELAKYYCPSGHDIKTVNFNEALTETNKLLQNEKCHLHKKLDTPSDLPTFHRTQSITFLQTVTIHLINIIPFLV